MQDKFEVVVRKLADDSADMLKLRKLTLDFSLGESHM